MNPKQKLFFKRFLRKMRASSITRTMEMESSMFRSLFSDINGKEPKEKDLENFKTLIWELRNYLDVLHRSLVANKGSEEARNLEEIIDYVVSNNSKRIFFGSFFISNREISLSNIQEIKEFREKYGFTFEPRVGIKLKAKDKKLQPKRKNYDGRVRDKAGKFKNKQVTDVKKRNEFAASLKLSK